MNYVNNKNKIYKVVFSLIGFILMLSGVSYAYFVSKVNNNESASTIVGEAANLELEFKEGSNQINGDDIFPGWSDTKTFTVKNNSSITLAYKFKIYNLTNNIVTKSIYYELTGNQGENIPKQLLGTTNRDISGSIIIGPHMTHSYTLTVYYENLDIDQSADKGKTFSFKIGIESAKNYINDYQLVEYIESNGGEYIDTLYKPNNNTRVYASYYKTNDYSFVFGARTNYSVNDFFEFFDAKPNVYWAQFYNSGINETLISHNNNTIHKVNMGNGYATIDDQKLKITDTTATFTGTYNLFIFGLNESGSIEGRKLNGRIYEFKIYDNGTIVRSMMPAVRKSDNVIGMYDTVNNAFYVNKGTGSFIKGNNIYKEIINLVSNPGFSQYTINTPTKTANGVTHSWDGSLNGLPSDSTKAYHVTSWGFGSNLGLTLPEIGYHAHMRIIDGNNIFRFKTNEDYVSKTINDIPDGKTVGATGKISALRWLGISQTLNNNKFTPSKKYSISIDTYGISGSACASVGLYYAKNSNTTKSFYSGLKNFYPTINKWTTNKVTITLDSDWDKKYIGLFVYGHYCNQGEFYVDNLVINEEV